ncbi:MAG TPA: hypothetical protein VJQ59_18105 [Candidatus Sulfotelmatobacter sp.]|nr:hypothetical protein [Candidatus Sulfotelmatobacter sp.]
MSSGRTLRDEVFLALVLTPILTVIAVGTRLLLVAAAFQLFDGVPSRNHRGCVWKWRHAGLPCSQT